MSENDNTNRAYDLQSVDRIIAIINNGDDGDAAAQDYRALIATLNDRVNTYGGTHKGKLTITLDFEADAKGVDVAMTTTVKPPPRPKFVDRYFISDRGDVLTARDPARESMFPGADLGRKRTSAL
ncbi:MAG: hypothetical protein FD149_1675 [Rhodospirillaceae bacterium]|nr:MAG: hypothetical protein FD149_1675 [Rhodospirillaceae bacterium]